MSSFSGSEVQKQQSGSISSMDWIVKYELFGLCKEEQFFFGIRLG